MILQRRRMQQRILVEDDSQIGEVRRSAQHLAVACGLDETEVGRVAIVATELATNLCRHGGGGQLLIQPVGAGGRDVIELIAIDRGRGMSDVERCLKDGYSTGGTAGTGLGAVQRLAAEFDIYSVPGQGTVVMARIGACRASRFGAISTPLKGEIDCGDSWAIYFNESSTGVMVIDGLGHGTFAAQAAEKAQEVFAEAPSGTPTVLLERSHRAMGGTRGAAAAVACLEGAQLHYAGVGNISGRLVDGKASQGLVSHNGTLGLRINRLQQFDYATSPGACLVMHSDGLSARWDLRENMELRSRHPAVVAGVLYRDFVRASDDATVVVVNS